MQNTEAAARPGKSARPRESRLWVSDIEHWDSAIPIQPANAEKKIKLTLESHAKMSPKSVPSHTTNNPKDAMSLQRKSVFLESDVRETLSMDVPISSENQVKERIPLRVQETVLKKRLYVPVRELR